MPAGVGTVTASTLLYVIPGSVLFGLAMSSVSAAACTRAIIIDRGRVVVRWAHEYHSSQLVPVFAFGPGSSAFSGVFDNTQFGVRIARLLDLKDFPQLADSLQN